MDNILSTLQSGQTPAKVTDVCHELCLKNSSLSKDDVLKLFEAFCENYWGFAEQQAEVFANFCTVIKNSSLEARIFIIPELMSKSIICNDFVFLAKEVLDTLPAHEKKKIDIYIPGWTKDDEYTVISDAEYQYRQTHGLKCWKQVNIFDGKPCCKPYPCRPVTEHDIQCFYCMLEISYLLPKSVVTYLYLHGKNSDVQVVD